MAETITFDGVDLESIDGLRVIGSDPDTPAPRTLDMGEIAHSNTSTISSAYYYSRKIHVLATLSRSSKSDRQSGMRELEGILQGIEKLLVLPVGGVSTEFTATKSNIISSTKGGFSDLDIEFACSNPTGYDVTPTTLYDYSSLVGPAYSFAVSWTGNVKQQPVITITLTSLLGGSNKTITVGNGTSELVIERDWTDSEILIINCRTKTVTVDGVNVPYTGRTPEFENNEAVTYLDTLSARDIAVTIDYQERNL